MKMKRRLGIGAIAVLAVGLFLYMMTPSAPAVDLVNGISPASDAFRHIGATLDQIAQLPENEREARLKKDWPNLSEGVVYYLRQMRRIPMDADVERVEFRFGSLGKVWASDGSGTQHVGYFNNQLVARVHVRGAERPTDAIVKCLNGMFAMPEDFTKLQPFGTQVPVQRFTIKRGEGLIHHVDPALAIALSAKHQLMLYRGQTMEARFQITPQQARQMLGNTDREQITVDVAEGDQFDLIAGTFTPGRRRSKS